MSVMAEVQAKARELAKDSKYFSVLEVGCLIRQFYVLLGEESKLAQPILGMYKTDFEMILETIFGIDAQYMIDRIFFVLDRNKDKHIGVDEWVETLGIFLREFNFHYDVEYILDNVFKAMDYDRDGKLSYSD
uniref:EF-hand domain-containing protein n=1 Tax=Periophthalmus magnuspinnatus TaxID=409849 RepID=A0A3B4BMB8_9GOBI